MPIFIPPIAYDLPAVLPETSGVERALFKYYGPYPRGRTVIRVGGVYRTVDTPDQLTLTTATEVYLGGHEYTIDATTAAALTAAGYGAYIV